MHNITTGTLHNRFTIPIISINPACNSNYENNCQFWFCERTRLVQPTHPDALPRFRKWDLTRLKTALENRRDLQFIEAGQVRPNPITPKKGETSSMSVRSAVMKNT